MELAVRELARVRKLTDALFRLIRPDSRYERPIAERHRLIFYLGHLEAFDWNLMARWALSEPSFHAEFDHLFAFGIDPPEGSLPQDQPADWPGVPEVEGYNQRVREKLNLLAPQVPEQLVHVAIEHRLMHAETFAYLLHSLPYERKIAPPLAVAPSGASPPMEMVEVPAGAATLGRPLAGAFGWDNEFVEHTVDVPEFAMSRHKITNGQYLEFVRAGAAPPYFWKDRQGEWLYRGMFAEIPLPLDWPVYVTHEEATAYAQWIGKRLPSEAQWHRAVEAFPERPEPACDNFDFHHWDPVPVSSRARITNLTGNGWEWTSTVFAPFAGFERFPFYPGYSADFFDGQHYVLKGASPRTAARLARRSFRNWFRPRYPYLYAGFRVVE